MNLGDNVIQGIGIDIVELKRIEVAMQKRSFIERVLTLSERERYDQLKLNKRQVEFLAGHWAAKEAFAKATGNGIGKKYGFQDIEIYYTDLGQPQLQVASFDATLFLSISHADNYAVAQVVIEK